MPSKADIVARARAMIGTPWRHQGRSPGRGLDCVGLLVKVSHELGIADEDFVTYSRYTTGIEAIGFFAQRGIPIEIEAAGPGDAVVITDTMFPNHCGILAERDGMLMIVHAHAGRRAVIEEQYTGPLVKQTVAAFAFPGVSD